MTRTSRAEAVLLALTMIWGSTFVIGKLVLREMTPLQMILIRFALASVIVLALFPRSIFPLRRDQLVKGTFLGVLLFLGFVVQTIGLTLTTASKSAFITGMMVVFVPVVQVLVERRVPKLGNIVGIVIVSAGLWFLTSPSGSTFNRGDALTLLCSILFGIYIVYLDVVAHDMSAVQLTFLQVSSNAILAFVALMLFERGPIHIGGESIMEVLYLTVFATVLTTFLQTKYQKDTSPTRAAIIFTIEPVFAAGSAALILGESIGFLGFLGGGLIIGGVLVSELSDNIPLLDRSLGRSDS